jgi:CHAT domain-containing protein/tetratricopeptide (TPR) repeat protein
MVPEEILNKAREGTMDPPEVESIVKAVAHQYKRPKLTSNTIDEYSDWEIRNWELARSLSNGIETARSLRRIDKEKAIRLAKAIYLLAGLMPGPNTSAQASFLIGYIYWDSGDYFDAIDPLTEATTHEAPLNRADAFYYRADALLRSHDLEAALVAVDELLEHANEYKLAGFVAKALMEKGQILAEWGRDDEAMPLLYQAVEVRRHLVPEQAEECAVAPLPHFLESLAQAARSFASYEEAISSFLEVAELERQAGNLNEQALAISEIGFTYFHMGEEERGCKYLEDAARVAFAAGSTEKAERWLGQVGARKGKRGSSQNATVADEIDSAEQAYQQSALSESLALNGQYEEALRAAQAVLQWAVQNSDFNLEISARSIRGKVLLDKGESKEGIDETRRAIVIADRRANHSAMLLLRGNLAGGLIQMKQHNQAVAVLLDGISRAQGLLVGTESSEFRQAIVAGASELTGLLALLMSHFDDHDRLLLVTEQARAINLGGWIQAELSLEELESSLVNGATEDLLDLRRIEVELEVRHLERKLDHSVLKGLDRQRGNCLSRLDTRLKQHGVRSLPWRDSLDSDSMDDLLRSIVKLDTAILCLFSVSEGICPVFIYEKEGQIVKTGRFIDWDRCDREQMLAAWSRNPKHLRRRGKPNGDVPSTDEMVWALGFESFLEDFDGPFVQFQEKLLGELAELVSQAQGSRLAVITHRDLAIIPFSSLLDRCQTLNSMAIAPSVRVLALCEKRRRQSQGDTILLADPLGDLPVERELDLVRKYRGNGNLNSPASFDELKTLASSCELIHAATHGMFFPAQPYHSGLVFSTETDQRGVFVQYVTKDLNPVDEPVPGGARLLTVAEIMGELSLKSCRLAVLSACESGLAREHAGGEMTGLPASLLVAGAKSVIASLWPVQDEATRLLMQSFYSSWQQEDGDEKSPARALADARNWLRALTQAEAKSLLGQDAQIPPGAQPYNHPYFTDAFQCYGSW